MKAFIVALAAVVVISVGAGVLLTTVNTPTGESYSRDSVRLGD